MAPLSEYELLRAANIKRNNEVLASMGLLKEARHTPGKQVSAPRPKKRRKLAEGIRRSSRQRRAAQNDEAWTPDGTGEAVARRAESTKPADRPAATNVATNAILSVEPAKAGRSTTNAATNAVLSVEPAKTGRSTCRLCRKQIEKGAWRVGMKAWIMGRSSLTWQCPGCFVKRLVVAEEASGRCKCKATGGQLAKGALKVGARSHTATSWLSPTAAPGVLSPVFEHVAASSVPAAREVEGAHSLSAKQLDAVQAVLNRSTALAAGSKPATKARAKGQGSGAARGAQTAVPRAESVATQPPKGEAGGAEGKVGWRFGAHVCFGHLLQSSETKTHCFARTHKGNTKTLKKGGDYWWVC